MTPPPPPSHGHLHLHRLIGQSLGYHGVIVLLVSKVHHLLYYGYKFREEAIFSNKVWDKSSYYKFSLVNKLLRVKILYIEPCSKADCYVYGPSLRQY